jgi:hypothetical protein
MSNEKKIEEKAIALAMEKMGLRDSRVTPEVAKKKSKWEPGLLRKVSEVEVRAEDQSMLARLDEDTTEIIGWRYPDRVIGSKAIQLTREEAIRIAESEVEIPEDAILESVDFLDRGAPGTTCIVTWKHVIDDISVEGDFVVVKINPETKSVISATKNWSVIESG